MDALTWTRPDLPDATELECHRLDRHAPAAEIRKAVAATVAAESGEVFNSDDVERIAKSALARLSISFGTDRMAKSTGRVDVAFDAQIVVKAEEERVVIGIVLEPTKEMGQPDSQGDVYSAAEVQKSAYNFMEQHQNVGLQHKADVTDRVKVILNWIALEDTTIGGQPVAKGTWLMGVRVNDDALWAAIKTSEITGFSIGGRATRTPQH